LSLQAGGHFVPHAAHQNGLEVDVRYVRRDGHVAPLDIRQSPSDYDALTTQTLMQSFLRRCDVSTVFADLPSLSFTNEELDRPVLVQAPGHSNHFHVRLRPPS
jgi:murein endopeptidase